MKRREERIAELEDALAQKVLEWKEQHDEFRDQMFLLENDMDRLRGQIRKLKRQRMKLEWAKEKR